MLPYTLDNHFTFGYNSGVFNLQDASPTKVFSCSYSKANYVPTSFKDECIKTAQDLSNSASNLGRTPVILLSGGLDSHVVVKAFAEIGTTFHTATTRFAKQFNEHELIYVEQLKHQLNFSHEYLDIDTETWLMSNEAMYMAEQSLCVYPQMLPTMKLIKYIWDQGGMPILGNGDFYVVRDINPKWRLLDYNAPKYTWQYIEYEYILAWFRFAIQNNILGGLGFFQHNAEITLAMALEEKIKLVCTDKNPYKMSSRSTKYLVYNKYWPDLKSRQKYHGGEKISGLCDMIRKNILLPKYRDYTREWLMDYHKFVDLLMP